MSSDKKHKVIIGEGTDYEKVLWIDRPKGAEARKMMPRVLGFAAKMQGLKQDEQDNIGSVLALVEAFWGFEEFENSLLPYVLGLNDEKGRKYLNENCTMMELMDAFNSAAGFLIEESFARAEVQAALGKSTEEAPTEAQ